MSAPAGRALPGAARRVVAGHLLAAVGMGLPWTLLLVLVWEATSDPWLLGLAGAARMLPYVVCSWAAGRLADRFDRDRIVHATVLGRGALLVVTAVAMAQGAVWVAVVAATLAVAVATPAYPALAAAMPQLAPAGRERATELLVTAEVASFGVGPALGGLLLGSPLRDSTGILAVLCVALGGVLLSGVAMPAPAARRDGGADDAVLTLLRASRPLRRVILAVASINAVLALAGLVLLPLAELSWADPEADYGRATAALGLGALAGPLLGWGGRGRRMVRGLGLVAAGLVLVALTGSLVAALLPLAVVGAAAVGVESAATGVIQDHAPDHLRATVLGITDTAMVAAAMVGSLLGPVLADLLGPRAALVAAAALAVGTTAALRTTRAPVPVALARVA